MLFWLSKYLVHYYHGFNVFHYITMRTILSALTALFISFLIGPSMIRYLKNLQIKQPIRDDGPSSHLKKAGTPTMGGALILVAITVATLLWTDLENVYVWVVLLCSLGFGLLGWFDDVRKLIYKNSKGLTARSKLFWQMMIALVAATILYRHATFAAQTALFFPFIKQITLDLGVFFIALTMLVIVGTGNAVNLTDGLDGLATMPIVLVGGALGIFAYVTGNAHFAEYLVMPYLPGVGEVCIICGAIVGAGLGFLWFNTYPAEVFMGDVGSLGLGAALGSIAVVTRQELVLMIMGGIFVVETLSVILQVASFKLRGKRIFKMAPIHHHFELLGWPEPKVIVRFWIITVILVLVGLSTLKLR